MLAQNFKTAANLKITDAEFDALLKVLGMLERGELVYSKVSDALSAHALKPIPNGFNMRAIEDHTGCGTTACIMGWARCIGGPEMFSRLSWASDPRLSSLFFWNESLETALPKAGRKDCLTSILPRDAAIALRNYLTHGEPRWEEAFA